MDNAFCEMNQEEVLQIEGGNPVAVYTAIVVGKYVVAPAAKTFAKAVVAGMVTKAVSELVN